jgi:hypothetical protein
MEYIENTKELSALILEYRNKILNITFHDSFGGDEFKVLLLKQIDEHFGIIHSFNGNV